MLSYSCLSSIMSSTSSRWIRVHWNTKLKQLWLLLQDSPTNSVSSNGRHIRGDNSALCMEVLALHGRLSSRIAIWTNRMGSQESATSSSCESWYTKNETLSRNLRLYMASCITWSPRVKRSLARRFPYPIETLFMKAPHASRQTSRLQFAALLVWKWD